jgi:hypothetical protein
MKSAIVLVVMVIVFSSCGRNSDTCRNRETMRLECRAVNQPTCDESFLIQQSYQ